MSSDEGRLTLLSYICSDEPKRLDRAAHAAQAAARHPVTIARRSTAAWLAATLAQPPPGLPTVIWQSVVNQYLDDDERAASASVFAGASAERLHG